MTTTNRAFIKAYRIDEPQAPPASQTAGVAAGHHAPAPHVPEKLTIAAIAPAAERAADGGPEPALDAARPTASNPATPPVREEPKQLGAFQYRTDSPEHSSAARPSPSRHTGEKRPLSSFIASAGIARLGTERADGDFFRPGTTVASFQWPGVCRALLRHEGDPLGRIADLLVHHAAAGRSLVGVLALAPHDGATTTTLCLASRLVDRRRRRVILVDGNFRRPRLAKWLDVEPTAGWQDVLKHGAPLTDAVIRATNDRLDLLALADKVPNDALRLASGLQAVVTAGVLRHAYDHVLLDAGAYHDEHSKPILLELMRNMGVDAAIAVTRSGHSNPGDIDALADQLARSGCEFLGIVENRAATPQAA